MKTKCNEYLSGPMLTTNYNGHISTIRNICFKHNGMFFASSSEDNSVNIWSRISQIYTLIINEKQWKHISMIKGYHKRPTYKIDWSINDCIATACSDSFIRIFNIHEEIKYLRENIQYLLLVSISNVSDCDLNSVQW